MSAYQNSMSTTPSALQVNIGRTQEVHCAKRKDGLTPDMVDTKPFDAGSIIFTKGYYGARISQKLD